MRKSKEILLRVKLIESRLGEVNLKLDQLLQEGVTIMADLTSLETQVQANTDTEASAVLLLNSLADMIKAAANDPVEIAAIAKKLKDSSDALASAIVTNTPAGP